LDHSIGAREKEILEIAHLSGKRHQSISHSIDKLYEWELNTQGAIEVSQNL
jgi:phage regulator Rha-like protein